VKPEGSKPVRGEKRKLSPFWRWIFLCSLIAQITLSVIFVAEANLGYHFEYGHLNIRSAIIRGTQLSTSLVLLSFTPHICRRWGVGDAILWLIVLFVLVCAGLADGALI